jgi:phage shock protein C
MNPRRLYRCRSDRKLAGVAAGMAEYFDLDPTLVRVLWLFSIFFGGFSILLYIILAFVVPPEPLALPGTGVAPDLASATPAWPAHWHDPGRRRGAADEPACMSGSFSSSSARSPWPTRSCRAGQAWPGSGPRSWSRWARPCSRDRFAAIRASRRTGR